MRPKQCALSLVCTPEPRDVWQGVLAAVVVSGLLMLAMMLETLAAVGWHQVLITVLTLAFGGWALWRSRQEVVLAPSSARGDTARVSHGFDSPARARALWWVDKHVLLAGGVLTLAGNAFAVDALARLRAAGEPRVLAEGLLGSCLLILVASVIFGIRRLR
jgi:hypothetical protein